MFPKADGPLLLFFGQDFDGFFHAVHFIRINNAEAINVALVFRIILEQLFAVVFVPGPDLSQRMIDATLHIVGLHPFGDLVQITSMAIIEVDMLINESAFVRERSVIGLGHLSGQTDHSHQGHQRHKHEGDSGECHALGEAGRLAEIRRLRAGEAGERGAEHAAHQHAGFHSHCDKMAPYRIISRAA